MENWKQKIKLYQINRNFYSFKDYSTEKEIVEHIIDYHKKNYESNHEVMFKENSFSLDGIDFYFYLFEEKDKISSWKYFLPDEITDDYDFKTISTSFVLFSIIESQIYALIGGKGISVIKRFHNPSFGIELLSKITEPQTDIVHKIVARSIIGRLSSEQKTYRNEQKLADALQIGSVPKEIFLTLNKVTKDSIFNFLNFEEDEELILHVGSSFQINKEIDFEETIQLLSKLHLINTGERHVSISRFEKVTDDEFCENNLKKKLLSDLRDDAVNLKANQLNVFNALDYDFAHPDKYIPFIEAEEYKAYFKGDVNPFYETKNRTKLYAEVLKAVYDEVVDETDLWDFGTRILGIRIKAFNGNKKPIEAPFINHLSCEVKVLDKPFFKIDNSWYTVKGDFINSINEECEAILKSNQWEKNFLDIKWNLDDSEGFFNKLYLEKTDTIVLDTILSQNIELCDILHFDDDNLYLIHVKKGFDAKMRDLTNQIVVSSNRLWNDVKSNKEFLNELFDNYEKSENYDQSFDRISFLSLFDKRISFVLAFCNESKRLLSVRDNVSEFRSNIAKFSLIQHVKEMNSGNYPVKIFEIEKEL